MLKKFKQSWRRFQSSTPGQRFQKRYAQHRKSAHGILLRIFFSGAGLLLVAAGIFFLPAPGPGLVIVVLGASLLAQESLWVARVLDGTELILRNMYARSVRCWRAASSAFKAFLGFFAVVLFAALALSAYRILFVN